MILQKKIINKINLRINLLNQIKNNRTIFEAIESVEISIKNGNKILVFGNGGSATQSSHFVSELVNKFYFERKGLPAIALNADVANLTSIANDQDFKYIFSKQIEAIGKEDDIVIAITTSGKSENILEAIKMSKKMNLKIICLCGNYIELLKNSNVDIIISVDSIDTPAIQEVHLFILHIVAEFLEERFFKKRRKFSSE